MPIVMWNLPEKMMVSKNGLPSEQNLRRQSDGVAAVKVTASPRGNRHRPDENSNIAGPQERAGPQAGWQHAAAPAGNGAPSVGASFSSLGQHRASFEALLSSCRPLDACAVALEIAFEVLTAHTSVLDVCSQVRYGETDGSNMIMAA
jgi:hypothetical protein